MPESPYIDRPLYLQMLDAWKENKLIKVIMGPRRCGKSALLEMFMDRLRERGVGDDQIIYLELNKKEYEGFLTDDSLHAEILRRWDQKSFAYLFIDEVQECRNFEEALASLQGRKNLDIYVTGSNSKMLSGELATLLTGRYLPINMLPFSFKEFRTAVASEGKSSRDDFRQYLSVGSFPEVIPYRNDRKFQSLYYRVLLEDMIGKDMKGRYSINDETTLRRLIRTLASSVGSAFSIRKISNTLSSEGAKSNNVTIGKYLEALENSYLFYRARRFDVRGRANLKSKEKFYLCDAAFRNHLVNTTYPDFGHLLENVVYLELLRRYPSVNIGKNGSHEVDFAVQDENGDFLYFQVAQSVMDPGTLEREISAFDGIPDNYPRILLTLDEFGANSSINGIHHLNAIDWLLS